VRAAQPFRTVTPIWPYNPQGLPIKTVTCINCFAKHFHAIRFLTVKKFSAALAVSKKN